MTTAQQRTPTPGQFRTFAVLALVYGALTLAVIPWAGLPGPSNPQIALVYGSGILIADWCTAFLLGMQYRESGRRALLVLACAYLYGGLMAVAHIATFPGAVFLRPLFGGDQTVGWLFLAWRLGTSALLLMAVTSAARAAPNLHRVALDRRLVLAGAFTVIAYLAILWLSANLQAEEIVQHRFTFAGRAIQWSCVALCAIGLAVIWRRRAFDDVFYLWLALVLMASAADLTLSNVAGQRYSLGWHLSRASFVVSSFLLLAFLLGDVSGSTRKSGGATAAAYGGAIAVVFAAIFVRWFLDPWLGEQVPFGTLYGAVAVAVWLGGRGPAVVATLVGGALAIYLFVEPRGTLLLDNGRHMLVLGLYAFACALITVLGETMRAARDRYRDAEVESMERAARLQHADTSKSQFLAILSHELRNPLAPLRNGLSILKMRLTGPDTGEVLNMMNRQIAQLARLVDDLLDVSRIDRGKLELQAERISLDSVVRSAIETAKPNIDAKRLELVVRYAGQPLHVTGDDVRLAQVIGNLLNNAAKFTPVGGRIELATWGEANHAVIRVSDNGRGMPQEQMSSIFDMFVQLDSSKVAGAGGLGLGLTLVRSIVELHGGRVEAHSDGLGKGSAFVVRLPLAQSPPAEVYPAETLPPTAVGNRILVVDDNEDAAVSLAELLRLDGHDVQTATDGAAALDIAAALNPQVAFIDLNMPGMDGIELARRLRSSPGGESVRLVAVTGMGQQSDLARTAQAGFDEHITKPADPLRIALLAAGSNGWANDEEASRLGPG